MYEYEARESLKNNSIKNLKKIQVVLGLICYTIIQSGIEQPWIQLVLVILILVILMVTSFRTYQSMNWDIKNRTLRRKLMEYLKKLPFLIILLIPSDQITQEMEKVSKGDLILILIILVSWIFYKKRRNVYKKT